MQRGLGGTLYEPVQEPGRRDRELTLGPFTLTLLGCVLLGLCGLCFFFGYTMGHRNSEGSAAAVPSPSTPVAVQPAKAPSKPAAGQSGAQPQQPSEAVDASAAADSDTAGAAGSPADATPASTANSSAAASTATPNTPVRTVLTTQPATAQSPAGSAVQPAAGQVSRFMVQIAAVAHSEDAEVLVDALRRRGYAANYLRDPGDGLLHVQIGPFGNRSDAYSMRQKLLNDGYNAIVEP